MYPTFNFYTKSVAEFKKERKALKQAQHKLLNRIFPWRIVRITSMFLAVGLVHLLTSTITV